MNEQAGIPGASGSVIGGLFQRDMEATRRILRGWFSERMNARTLEVTTIGPMREAGLSHELLSLEIAWDESGTRRSAGFVVRLDPVEYRKRHTSNLRREFEVQSVLHRRGDVPVPEVCWYESDAQLLGAEFYAMKRLAGRTLPETPPWQLGGWFIELDAAGRRALWRNAVSMLARIPVTTTS